MTPADVYKDYDVWKLWESKIEDIDIASDESLSESDKCKKTP